MHGRAYTDAELQLLKRLLEDMELGRWPLRAERPAALDEPETVAAVWRVGEVVRELEQTLRARDVPVCRVPANGGAQGFTVEESAA